MNREGLIIISGNLVLLTVGTLLIFTLLPTAQSQSSISPGGGDSEGPTNEPGPNQEPDDEPSQQDIPFDKLHGVNFIDPVLNRKEGNPKLSVQTDFVDEFVTKANASNFNVFRIPVRWEAYVGNEDNFLAELVYLVKTSNESKIFVWIDFHHFDATSNWESKVSNGNGFPNFIVSCYKPVKSYERDPEVRAFWNDYYLNKVRDSENSCEQTLDVWRLQAEFMKAMINKIDDYPNVLGYEIINEPHVWEDAQYEYLGDMHTAISKELRTATDKVLFFTRETAHGLEPDGTKYTRKYGLEHKILPRDPIKNVMYVPHLYDLEEIQNHISEWKEVQRRWSSMGYDVKIGVGEWSPQPPQLISPAVTRQNMDGFVSVWADEGWMSTYWAYGGFNFGEGNVLVKPTGDLSGTGKHYLNSINKYYGTGQFGGSDEEPDWKTFTVKGGDKFYYIQYWITGGRVVNILPSVDTSSMMIAISPTSYGRLTFEIPRELIDSRTGADGRTGADKDFVVFLDGVPSDTIVETKATDTLRTLAIDFGSGTETIEIVGMSSMFPSNPDKWKTAYAVGKFTNSIPPLPDQIFKFQYRVTNGTMDSFDIQQERYDVFFFHTIVANVSSTDGVFEIKYPRNFPYTNSIGGIEEFVFLVEDEDGSIEDERTTTGCFFVFSVPFTGSTEIKMTTASILIRSPYHGDNIPDSCKPQTLVENVQTMKDGTIAPLYQFRAGVASEDTICPETRQGEKLMLLVSPDGRPFCVKLSDEEFMKKRGWTEPYQK